MGQCSSSVPPGHWHARLVFESDSLHNNKASCPELGLRYQISSPRSLGIFPTGTTSIVRRDCSGTTPGDEGEGVLLAEIEKHSFKSDRIRLLAQGDGLDSDLDSDEIVKGDGNGDGLDDVPFVKEGDFLKLVTWKSTKRAFHARNGQSYVWVTATRDGSVQLFRSGDEKITLPIARLSYGKLCSLLIELAHGTEEIVDEILVTALIMEKKVREERAATA